jgi:organic radical activating enzyme
MKFIKGRDNLSVTVYVPYDCLNNCKFCSSKKEYQLGTNVEKIKEQLKKVRNSSIKEVVFTGGEPMSNVKILKELISIVDNKHVYINTTFIKTNLEEFITLVNNTSCIKGVNISRHCDRYEEDSLFLNNIVRDEFIQFLFKPVKINVVIPDNKIDVVFAKEVIYRWSKCPNVKVCFRANFNNTSSKTLHSLTDKNIEILGRLGEFNSRSYCDVCDTVTFTGGDFFKIPYSYHRGLSTTAIQFAGVTEVNDIILFPNGELAYDWDRKNNDIETMCREFGIENVEDDFKDRHKHNIYVTPFDHSSCGTFDNYSSIGSFNHSACGSISSGGCGYRTISYGCGRSGGC